MRDTIARQSDVDAKSIKYEIEPGTGRYRNGTIAFSAKEGQSIDLQKLQDSLRATRLGKGTRSGVNFFQITVEGEVVVGEKETLLKVSGTQQQFTLGDDPQAKPKDGTKPAYQRLRAALANGEKIAHVTGRVQGWSGPWPKVLKALAAEPGNAPAQKPALLMVTDFQTVKK
ncbi:MAG: hypothetical protein L0Z62_06370 [Gemmataceae bacterium]|nr:hypothetical protein [Gemmataceae bacterium]